MHVHLRRITPGNKTWNGRAQFFYLIYKEALYNIVKYADCKTATIKLNLNRPVIHLEIRDVGKDLVLRLLKKEMDY